MLVNGRQNKRLDPMCGSAIGMSSAHAIPPQIFEEHRPFKKKTNSILLPWTVQCPGSI
ncbi:hypothetical protein C2G38_2101462 [Gigaspora rosea]|uniref:Uncharacterized protein n=1 Tax=Gigaspora rosea TaxID=44941 RepID=A0A397USC4_9GLOM|nr:hypothetical protein C2G38_2101462 [Gigaspora rosea]